MKEVEETTVLACELARRRLEDGCSKGDVSVGPGTGKKWGSSGEDRMFPVEMWGGVRCGCLREVRSALMKRRSGEG